MGPGSLLHDLDHELDAEHGKWLRRRFLWYCGIGIAFSLPCVPVFLVDSYFKTGGLRTASLISGGALVVSLVLYVVAFISALRTQRDRAKIAELAILLTVVTVALSLLAQRVSFSYSSPAVMAGALDSTQSETAIRVTRALASMFFLAVTQLTSLAIAQLFACLIIPWTTRESLLSALSILVVYITLLVLDVMYGWIKAPAIAVFGVTAAVMFLSPSIICWWRYSSWRQRWSLTLENRRFRAMYQELTAARRIHESILPKPQPEKALAFSYAYEPAREIGGDLLYVDPSPHPRGHLRLLILDVTGHGIAAALTVNRIVGEVQRVLAEAPGASPGRLLSALNHYACLTLSQHQVYASALCMEISAIGLTYASAGHPTAFVVSPAAGGGGPTVRELESTTFLLGCVPPDDFDASVRSVELGLNDVVVAYTDGASESSNPAGRQLLTAGFAGLVRSMVVAGVQPQALSQRLQEAVARHRATPPQDDTLIVTAWLNPTASRLQGVGLAIPFNKLPE